MPGSTDATDSEIDTGMAMIRHMTNKANTTTADILSLSPFL